MVKGLFVGMIDTFLKKKEKGRFKWGVHCLVQEDTPYLQGHSLPIVTKYFYFYTLKLGLTLLQFPGDHFYRVFLIQTLFSRTDSNKIHRHNFKSIFYLNLTVMDR